MSTSEAMIARVTPPDGRLPLFQLLRTVVGNPLKAWPRSIYREPIVRSRVLGRDTVYVMAPELIRQVLLDDAEIFGKGEINRRALGPALGEAILTADGPRWRWQRRAVAPLFRQERIRSYLPTMIAAAERTRERWRSHPAGAELDIAHEMMRMTFDIILSTILPGRSHIDAGLMEQAITDYLEPTSWIVALVIARAPRWMPYPGMLRQRRAGKVLHRLLDALISEAKQQPSGGNDLLSLLRNATDAETGQSMTDIDVRNNLLTFVAAGHETTAVALSWTFYLLSVHPEIDGRVRDEIATVTGGAALSAEHVEQLAYTRQVIQESMRLYPPAALVLRSALKDVQVGGEMIRAGTTVYVPVYAVHRHETYWSDPDTFDPSRFEPDAAKARDRYLYIPFGAGQRVCIGQSFAQVEAAAVLATLLRPFRLRLRPGYVPEPKLRVTLRPAEGMPMQITPLGG
jgi:cytochrome P450